MLIKLRDFARVVAVGNWARAGTAGGVDDDGEVEVGVFSDSMRSSALSYFIWINVEKDVGGVRSEQGIPSPGGRIDVEGYKNGRFWRGLFPAEHDGDGDCDDNYGYPQECPEEVLGDTATS